MRMRISTGQPLSGYFNVNPLEGHDVVNLPIEPASCYHIVADDFIDYIPSNQLASVLKSWVSRLRHKGRITVGGVEALEVSRRYFIGELSTEQFNEAVYGSRNSPWNFKHGVTTLPEVVEILTGLGLKILKKRLDEHTYLVEAERP